MSFVHKFESFDQSLPRNIKNNKPNSKRPIHQNDFSLPILIAFAALKIKIGIAEIYDENCKVLLVIVLK